MTKRDSTLRSGTARSGKSSAKSGYPSPVDKRTMRHFDDSCLTPVKPLTPEEIAAIRKREEVSQSVFARYLGLSVTLISQWERGEKKPQGASLKLLTLVEKNGLDFVA
jgi:putative transcriptional regulator